MGLREWLGFGRRKEPQRELLSPDDYFTGNEAWIAFPASSHVHSAAYLGQGAAGEMRLRFKDEKTGALTAEYFYRSVPNEVWFGLLSAASKGGYCHRYVYHHFSEGPVWKR